MLLSPAYCVSVTVVFTQLSRVVESGEGDVASAGLIPVGAL